MTEANGERKKPKDRSPAYPGIPLEQAIERARTLYEQEKRNAAPATVAMRHWGYTPKSSNGQVALAALKYFGLVTSEGVGEKRMVRLSDLGLRIVQDQRAESPDRDKAIKEVALNPPIHKELWTHYQGELPSEDALRYWLVNEKRFTENGASEFIRHFRATTAFAGLSASDSVGKDDEEEPDSTNLSDMTGLVNPPKTDPDASTGRTGKPQIFNLPLSPTEVAVIQVPAKMNERLWSQMLKVLDAMKPGIVSEAEDPQDG